VSNDGKVRILAVDDNPAKLLALSAVLSELKETVVTASSGRDALRLLLQQEFAVVLLDVHMPGMDGFETAALMRQRKSSEHTPIIFVTAFGDDTHSAQGYQLGAVDYILTPIMPDVLRTKVSVFVELYKKTEEVKRQAARIVQIEQKEHKRQLAEAVDRLAGRGREELGSDEPEIRATYELRYEGQAFELPVGGDPRPDPAELRRAFDRAHEDRYGYSDPDAELELVTIRVAVALPGAEPRPAEWDGLPAEEVRGPEVVALPGSTLVIPEGWRARAEDDLVVMER